MKQQIKKDLAYGVHIYLSVDTIFWSYQNILNRELLLTRKLLDTGFLVVKYMSTYRKIYTWFTTLEYISVALMTMDILFVIVTHLFIIYIL